MYILVCMLLSCHVRVSEWIHILLLGECQGTPCSKQTPYLKLSDSNEIVTHNHSVRKRTFNNLAKLTKWLSCVVSTYLSVHLAVCYYHVTYKFQSESTLCSLPKCQGTPCSKQTPYLKFKWQQWDSNPRPLNS